MRRLVVGSDDALREIAPEMGGRLVRGFLWRKGLVGMRHGEHFLGAQMAAAIGVHTSPFSLSKARRMSACAIGAL